MPDTHYSPAKKQQYVLVCDLEATLSGDITRALSILQVISGSTAIAIATEGSLTLVFDGFDDDPRELGDIPEVRAWFTKLATAWPYWSFFANRTDHTISILLTFLLPGTHVTADEPGQTLWSFDLSKLKPMLFMLFSHQNELVDRLGIPEEINERATTDFMEAVTAFID
jgi:hypothetical protein